MGWTGWQALRERYALVFVMGLAVSVASFVENLKMGHDAIVFLTHEIGRITGWTSLLEAIVRCLHVAFEWWRATIGGLLSYLPFHIPKWLHDPISVLLFGTARVWDGRNRTLKYVAVRKGDESSDLPYPFYKRYSDYLTAKLVAGVFVRTFVGLVVPMMMALFVDRFFYAPEVGGSSFVVLLSAFGALALGFVVAYTIFLRLSRQRLQSWRKDKVIYENDINVGAAHRWMF